MTPFGGDSKNVKNTKQHLADHPGSFKTLASFYITLSSVSYT
jgi:hypothetical protein